MIPHETLQQFRAAYEALVTYSKAEFPCGSKVRVNNPGRYVGPGISRGPASGYPDKLAVELPNGNTWWYPIETIESNEVTV